MKTNPKRVITYALGFGSLSCSVALGSQLATVLLIGLYGLRRIRAFRSMMS